MTGMQHQLINQDDKEPVLFGLRAHFGSLPLISGEDNTDYRRIFTDVLRGQQLCDRLSEIWANDIAILTIEVLRYRRLKAKFVEYVLSKAIAAELIKSLHDSVRDALMTRRAKGDEQTMKEIEAALNKRGLSTDVLMGKVFGDHIDQITKMDVVIAAAEKRRIAAFDELDRHEEKLLRASARAAP